MVGDLLLVELVDLMHLLHQDPCFYMEFQPLVHFRDGQENPHLQADVEIVDVRQILGEQIQDEDLPFQDVVHPLDVVVGEERRHL